ncbi:flagellar protein (plasmid) [Azospirillum argentinense]|uniref:Flagellar protein n=1 Tax=Azospirillum argentinense TaxID=2970906 RepID=A0A060DLU8_9PROT|nr:flagellar biosynthesis repressor FlbT [Azospirillum argentinense]AIB13872.1 flagellar protein [Azospirillum argentinense]EZQ05842.1 flagellar protein [Azospirillum argentinense]PNR00512.1 flagellar protein [Azospirillum argentinense]
MPLKFVLRPNEKVIINGAVIGAGDRPGSFFLYNTANFLRGREVLKEEQIDCIEKKLYFVIQLIYIFPEDAVLNLQRFASILAETRDARPDCGDDLDEIERLVEARNYYRALKICRKMFKGGSEGPSGTSDGAAESPATDPAP